MNPVASPFQIGEGKKHWGSYGICWWAEFLEARVNCFVNYSAVKGIQTT